MISGITNDATSAAASAAMKKATGMNKDDFLKLFITQLKHQDPLNPQDGTEFIGQLAQLTQVEQAYNTNSNLQNLLAAANNSANMTAVSYIGKQVLAEGNEVALATGGNPRIGFRLDHQAAQVLVDIRNEAGITVRTLFGGASQAGDVALAWDGRDSTGQPLPAGTYNYTVAGINTDGERFEATPLMAGTVDGLSLKNGEAILTIGGAEVPLSKIISVKEVT